MTKLDKKTVYVAILIIVLQLAVAVNSIWYANKVGRDSGMKWCSLVVSMDDAYSQQPPTTPTGRRIAQEMHDLRASLDCEEAG